MLETMHHGGAVHPLLSSWQSLVSFAAKSRQSPPFVPLSSAAFLDKHAFSLAKSYSHGESFSGSSWLGLGVLKAGALTVSLPGSSTTESPLESAEPPFQVNQT
jgi:hypothetical protein